MIPGRMLTAALAALVFVAPLLCLPGSYDAANLPQSAWIDVAAWLLLASCLSGLGLRGAALPVPLLAFLAWALLALGLAELPAAGLLLFVHWTSCAVLFLAACARFSEEGGPRPILVALHWSVVLVAALGVAQFLGIPAWVPQAIPPAATFVNKNVAAGFVVLAWPLGLWLWRGCSGRTAWLLGLGLALEGLYCFCAFSRSAWLALAVQLLLLAWWRLRPAVRRLAIPLALILAGTLPFLAQRLPGPLGEASRHLTSAWRGLDSSPTRDVRVLSIQGRLAMWSNTLAMVRAHPLLGVGLGGAARAYPPYAYASRPDPFFSAEHQLDYVHNDFLQAAAEQGLPGLALLLALLWSAATHLRRRLSGASASERHDLEVGALVLAGACVDACFSFPLERALPPMLLALAAALVCRRAPRQAGRSSAALAAGSAVAALALGLLYARELRADRLMASMFSAERHGDRPAARAAAVRALELKPRAFEPAFVLAVASIDRGEPEQALQFMERALAQRPHDPATLGTRAAVFGALGDLARAETDARRVAELLPRDPSAQFEWGLWLERAARSDEAQAAFARACALAPGRADYRLKLAVSAYRSGARDVALQAARAVLDADPRSALAHKLLGILLLGDPATRAEALAHLRQALEIDPSVSDAERLRALLAAQGGPP